MRALVLLAACLACTPNFQSQSEVSDLRVLAIRADPPEAQATIDGGVVTDVDDVRITLLVADPARPQNLATVTSALCAPTTNRRCDPGFPLPKLVQPMDSTFGYTIRVPPAAVQGALSSDKLAGFGGIRLQLQIAIDDGDPAGAQAAEKTLVYSRKDHVPNHVPLLDGLALTRDTAPDGTLLPGDVLHLKRGVARGLRPIPHACPPSGAGTCVPAIEGYDTVDLQGKAIHLTEQLRYSFFLTAGAEVSRENADEPLGGVAPPDGLTQITGLAAGPGRLWVVVRDGRGGESWLEYAYDVI